MALGRLSNRGKLSRLGSRLAVELAPRHSFYDWCNEILAEFDEVVEMLCHPYYSDGVGRPSVPPGRYFRMLFVGQYEQGNRISNLSEDFGEECVLPSGPLDLDAQGAL